jgi:hypothetical protein
MSKLKESLMLFKSVIEPQCDHTWKEFGRREGKIMMRCTKCFLSKIYKVEEIKQEVQKQEEESQKS